MRENILFICGSLNQTTMMHKIARHLTEYNCYFTPYYADGLLGWIAAHTRWLDFTVLSGRHRRETEEYLAQNSLPVDWRGESREYDLVITGSDLLVQRNIKGRRLVLVQEGITEPEGLIYHLVKTFRLPRYLANTATSGLSNAYDIFCVASHGYRDLFIRKGVQPDKVAVTGIPNFDFAAEAQENDFPYHGFVLAATSPLRETFRYDDRRAFIKKCARIAGRRLLIFKLHPTEKVARAAREIHRYAPGALVFAHGDVNHMIANASVLITQQSTCTFVGLALGKEVHTNLNVDELRRLMPIQNDGASSQRIANICRRVLHTSMPELAQVRAGFRRRPRWEQADAY